MDDSHIKNNVGLAKSSIQIQPVEMLIYHFAQEVQYFDAPARSGTKC